jgi:hypothetical protein
MKRPRLPEAFHYFFFLRAAAFAGAFFRFALDRA